MERLFLLHSLRKKYGYTSQDIIAHHQEIKQNIDDLINYEDNILKLENELNTKRINATSFAKKISNIRKKYAENLQNEVNKQHDQEVASYNQIIASKESTIEQVADALKEIDKINVNKVDIPNENTTLLLEKGLGV